LLPNFICPGAQKAGTTTLHNILKQHPDIFLPNLKEAHFFDIEDRYKKGILWWIDNFFYNYSGQKAIGAITPAYLYFEKIPERILNHLGSNIKLIFMLRNPVDRAYSNYWMAYNRGYETETFKEAIDLESSRLKIDEFHRLNFSYIDRGLYAKQIKRYIKLFPEKNMFYVIFETDFLRNREELIGKLLNFLGVESNVKLDIGIKSNPSSLPKIKFVRGLLYDRNKYVIIKRLLKPLIPKENLQLKLSAFIDKINQNPFKPPKLDENFKKYLIKKYFYNDIKELETIINRDLSFWIR
jgi:hypothetical protein